MVAFRRGGRGSDPTTPVPATAGLRWLVVALLAAAVLAVTPPLVGGWLRQPQPAGPVEVVEQFFTAIADRDLDRALGYVVAVPYGHEAALLRPEAIGGGWRLLAAQRVDGAGPGYGTWVQVTVGDGRSQASGWVEVSQDDRGQWWLVDPWVTIEVASVAPLTYIQVNGVIVSLTDLYAADPLGAGVRYRLLPGPYRFFGQLPGLDTDPQPVRWLLPSADPNPDPVPVTVPPLRLPAPTLAVVQRQVNTLLDDCTGYAVREPAGCPFAAGVEVGASERDAVRLLRDISWTVVEYPTVQVHDPGGRDRELGLPVTLSDPGRVRLTVTGERYPPPELVAVSVDCQVSDDPDPMRVLFDPGGPRVYQPLVAGAGLVSAFPAIVEPTCPPESGGNR